MAEFSFIQPAVLFFSIWWISLLAKIMSVGLFFFVFNHSNISGKLSILYRGWLVNYVHYWSGPN